MGIAEQQQRSLHQKKKDMQTYKITQLIRIIIRIINKIINKVLLFSLIILVKNHEEDGFVQYLNNNSIKIHNDNIENSIDNHNL